MTRPQIESARLRLIPLTTDEVRSYLLADFSLEKQLGLELHPRSVPENVQKALRERVLARIEADPENHLFYTLWVAVDKTINTLVAGIVFKGPPNENGEVELGAGTLDGFMNRGYMTETTRLLCDWALKNARLSKGSPSGGGQGVKHIVANVSPSNGASLRTLEKCGFVKVSETGENTHWRYRH